VPASSRPTGLQTAALSPQKKTKKIKFT
jgi:hypothetical protein